MTVVEETLGQYVENSMRLSWSDEDIFVDNICKKEDGTIVALASNGEIQISADNGKKWNPQEETIWKEWIKGNEKPAIVDMAPDGTLFAVVLDWEKDVMENLDTGDFGDQYFHYFYQKPGEEAIQGKIVIPAEDSVYDAFITEDGRIWGYGGNGLCEIDSAKQEYSLKYQTEGNYPAYPPAN